MKEVAGRTLEVCKTGRAARDAIATEPTDPDAVGAAGGASRGGIWSKSGPVSRQRCDGVGMRVHEWARTLFGLGAKKNVEIKND